MDSQVRKARRYPDVNRVGLIEMVNNFAERDEGSSSAVHDNVAKDVLGHTCEVGHGASDKLQRGIGLCK